MGSLWITGFTRRYSSVRMITEKSLIVNSKFSGVLKVKTTKSSPHWLLKAFLWREELSEQKKTTFGLPKTRACFCYLDTWSSYSTNLLSLRLVVAWSLEFGGVNFTVEPWLLSYPTFLVVGKDALSLTVSFSDCSSSPAVLHCHLHSTSGYRARAIVTG